jgi:N-acetylglucosamine-6-phosphate deacetylase
MKSRFVVKGNIVLSDRMLPHSSLFIDNGKIEGTESKRKAVAGATVIDARGSFVAPGFIDTHIHGSPEAIVANELKRGTTSAVLALSCGKSVDPSRLSPYFLGVRLEGPFISKAMAGAQDKRFIRNPSTPDLLKLFRKSARHLLMVLYSG